MSLGREHRSGAIDPEAIVEGLTSSKERRIDTVSTICECEKHHLK